MCKSNILLIAALAALFGCGAKENTPKPSMAEIQAAIDRNVAIINQRTGASIKKLSVGWADIDESCYEHLDYFAQNIIFSVIFYPEKDYMTITCGSDPKLW